MRTTFSTPVTPTRESPTGDCGRARLDVVARALRGKGDEEVAGVACTAA